MTMSDIVGAFVEEFVAALQPWGIQRQDIPMSLNLFMNCPQDLTPCNSGVLTPLGVTIYRPAA